VSEKLSISVVIPAFNEEAGIAGVVESVRVALDGAAAESEVLVIDDGSSDRTSELAEKAGARVLRHAVNIGYGKALLTGFSAARFEWIVMIDGDGSYAAEDILKLIEASGGADMVVGARQGTFFWGSPFKAILRGIYLRLAGFVAGLSIPDANSGLRLLRKKTWSENHPILCLGYSYSTTLSLSFIQAGRFVKFVPVQYLARKGKSKVSMLRDMLRTLQIMVQVALFYNPLKFTAVLALLPLAMGAGFVSRYACCPSPLDLAAAAACVLSTLAVFLFGCHLDAMRLHNRKDV